MKANIPTITVSGAHSDVGKTTVVERLLKELKGWSCLKVTLLHNGPCPTGRNCGACDKMSSRFSIVSDKKITEERGKDTWRFKKAGAKKVLWLRAEPAGLKQGLKKAISMFSAAGGSTSCAAGASALGRGGKYILNKRPKGRNPAPTSHKK